MNWLVKEEPGNYHFDQFSRDGRTQWTGVKNPLAQKHLRSIKEGEQVFYYHTGAEKAVVGVARALRDAYPDPADPTGKSYTVDFAPVRKLARPVTLASIKADPFFKTFPLVRMSRLSVMPVENEEWLRIEEMAREGVETDRAS